jgi:hypothetical protein
MEEDQKKKILAQEKLDKVKEQKEPTPMPVIYFKSQENMLNSEKEIAKFIGINKRKPNEYSLDFDDEEIEETFDHRTNLVDASDDEIPLDIDFEDEEDLKSQQLYNEAMKKRKQENLIFESMDDHADNPQLNKVQPKKNTFLGQQKDSK